MIISDISHGEEAIPIPAFNDIDDEPPFPFHYIATPWLSESINISENPAFLQGCDCMGGNCSENCSCNEANEGRCAYDSKGRANLNMSFPIYECNDNCKCNCKQCHNRVVQKGIHIPLEIFKTLKCGWGIRTSVPIRKGTFLCCYAGEILKEYETEERGKEKGDEYLMNMDTWLLIEQQSCRDDESEKVTRAILKNYERDVIVDDVDDRDMLCIDAKWFGNIARFMNHSCDPNVTVRAVFVEYQDKRLPRSCFFANRDIAAGEELCYDYGYVDGSVKGRHKPCFCGSAKCRKNLY
ncbi:hypothetical protein WA158_007930 [Blastocystis sp. Blastoise]